MGFTLAIAAPRASGALVYRLYYGDGTSTQNVAPQFCIASPQTPKRASWHLSHRYPRAGTYRVLAVGSVNCSSARASVTTVVVIAGRSG